MGVLENGPHAEGAFYSIGGLLVSSSLARQLIVKDSGQLGEMLLDVAEDWLDDFLGKDKDHNEGLDGASNDNLAEDDSPEKVGEGKAKETAYETGGVEKGIGDGGQDEGLCRSETAACFVDQIECLTRQLAFGELERRKKSSSQYKRHELTKS